QPLPAPGHRPHRHDHDPERGDEVAEARVRELVPGAVEVDLRDQVPDREARDDERPGDAERPSHARNRSWSRWSAARTSATSSSATCRSRIARWRSTLPSWTSAIEASTSERFAL